MLPRLLLHVFLLGLPLASATSSSVARSTPATVTVKAGETVYRIARAHGLTPDELRAINGLKDNTIHAGQVLRLKRSAKSAAAKSTPKSTASASAQPAAKAAQKSTQTPAARQTVARNTAAQKPAGQQSPARKTAAKIPAKPASPVAAKNPAASKSKTATKAAPKTATAKTAPGKTAAAKPSTVKKAIPAKPVVRAAPSRKAAGQGSYTVQGGDSLGRVARRYGVSVGALQAANGLRGTLIHPGQRLVVPARGAGGGAIASEPKLPPGMELRVVYTYIRVGLGETPGSLAAKYGLTPDALRRLNGLNTVQAMLPGTKLLVPERVPMPIPPAVQRAAVSFAQRTPMNIPVQVVNVDLRHRDVLVAPVLPSRLDAFGLGASVGQLARRSSARAVVNGSYFHPQSYAPAGDIVMQGRMVTWGRIPMALAITPDNRATIRSTTTPLLKRPLDTTWAGMETVIATGPRILSGGQVVTQYSGVFQDPALFGKAARSAVGLSSNRDLMFVTTHVKLTTTQMGQVMARLGLRDALLLDGGSSAGIAWNGSAVLDSVRKVSYGIGVFTGYTGKRYAR